MIKNGVLCFAISSPVGVCTGHSEVCFQSSGSKEFQNDVVYFLLFDRPLPRKYG